MKRNLTGAGLVVAALAALASCGDDGISASATADIVVDQSTISFVRKQIGRSDIQKIAFSNPSVDVDLEVTAIYLRGAAEKCDMQAAGGSINADDVFDCEIRLVRYPEVPLIMPPQAKREIEVGWFPQDEETPDPVTLVIESNASQGEQTVTLDPPRNRPEIGTDKTTISFAGGAGRTEFILVSNRGNGTLVVSEVNENLQTQPATNDLGEPVKEFEISFDRDLPWNIGEGQAETVTVTYNPVDGNEDTLELQFVSNDAGRPEHTVTLTSQAVSKVLRVEPNPVRFADMDEAAEGVGLTFYNDGIAQVLVQGITIKDDNPDYDLAGDSFTAAIAGGSDWAGPKVKFEGADGAAQGTLVITTDADNAVGGVIEVPIIPPGAGLPALIEFDPPTLDFNDLTEAGMSTQPITVSNPGGSDLVISRIVMDANNECGNGPTDAAYAITAGGEGVTVPAGGEHTIEVTLTRGENDPPLLVGSVLVESNAVTPIACVYAQSRAE